MLVTDQSNRQNRRAAIGLALACVLIFAALGFVSPWWLLGIPSSLLVYYFVRRSSLRRLNVMALPFPNAWEKALMTHVQFFRALDEAQRIRFRNLVNVFLDEVPITGIRTEVDETTRALVAASAVIPIFGFDDWEYSGLGEVLIYPSAFGDEYRTDDGADKRTLGMVGDYHLSGVMILSKPALLAGFSNADDKRNVGIHEFAHLVDKADGSIDGIPAGMPNETAVPWIQWVAKELRSTSVGKQHIDDYAYTNEAEYFAVLTEYFFEAPDVLEKKNPQLYQMLQSMYRQNTKSFLSARRLRRRIGRNTPCPCGSGQKYKRCCRRKSRQGVVS
jgi:Mlc titration factor MtfA (ptsG expression regulator)